MRGVKARLPVAVIAFLLIAGLGGCLDFSSEPARARFVVDGREPCDSSIVLNCAEIAQDENAPYRIGGFEISGGGNLAALFVRNVPRSIVIEDLEVRGFDLGMTIFRSGCAACEITLRSVRMDVLYQGLELDRVEAAIVLEDVQIKTGRQPTSGTAHGRDMPRNLSISSAGYTTWTHLAAVNAINSTISYELRDVRMEAARPVAATALSTWDNAEVRSYLLEDVYVANFIDGLDLRTEGSVEGTGIDIVCVNTGITTGGWGALKLSDIEISGCSREGIRMGNLKSAELSDIRVTASYQAVTLGNAGTLVIERFDLSGNGWGLFVEGDNLGKDHARIGPGVASDNAYGGLMVRYNYINIFDVELHRNGGSWPDPDYDVLPGLEPAAVHGGLIIRYPNGFLEVVEPMPYAIVRGVSFEGNMPYAVSHIGGVPPIDAAENWWGDPLGPSLAPYRATDLPALTLGDGDRVTEGVLFTPWLQAPP